MRKIFKLELYSLFMVDYIKSGLFLDYMARTKAKDMYEQQGCANSGEIIKINCTECKPNEFLEYMASKTIIELESEIRQLHSETIETLVG